MHNPASVRTNHIHNIGPTTKSSNGISIAHRLGIGRQVPVNTIERLRPSLSNPKPCFDLINNEHRAVLGAQIPQAL